jgi:hypothetical protein
MVLTFEKSEIFFLHLPPFFFFLASSSSSVKNAMDIYYSFHREEASRSTYIPDKHFMKN